jgi:hypothetical protein
MTRETTVGSIRNQLVRAAAAGALGVAAMAGFIAPASASQVAAAHTAGAAAAAKPSTDIEGSPAKWVPAKLTIAPITGKCTKTNYSFSIHNKTTKSQTIYSGKTTGTLKAGQAVPLCITAKSGSFKVGIKGSTSVLTVTIK